MLASEDKIPFKQIKLNCLKRTKALPVRFASKHSATLREGPHSHITRMLSSSISTLQKQRFVTAKLKNYTTEHSDIVQLHIFFLKHIHTSEIQHQDRKLFL